MGKKLCEYCNGRVKGYKFPTGLNFACLYADKFFAGLETWEWVQLVMF